MRFHGADSRKRRTTYRHLVPFSQPRYSDKDCQDVSVVTVLHTEFLTVLTADHRVRNRHVPGSAGSEIDTCPAQPASK